jgi:hypothetical protein
MEYVSLWEEGVNTTYLTMEQKVLRTLYSDGLFRCPYTACEVTSRFEFLSRKQFSGMQRRVIWQTGTKRFRGLWYLHLQNYTAPQSRRKSVNPQSQFSPSWEPQI